MIEQQKNNPLHGIKLEALLTELVDHYGFDILAEQININCFKTNASIMSSLKFLRKTQWARDKVEAFYLYKYKGLPIPSDEQHAMPPRDRLIDEDIKPQEPADIELGEGEFFDDPISGPKPFNTQGKSTGKAKSTQSRRAETDSLKPSQAKVTDETPDPWAKWRKNESEE